ncbi:molybdopterin converting factor subunit 1 [Calidifontibacillus oryziterrae]|uniref:molybdopterin converting factor subunit 1 n=1 Tax=Calidifontibacillus oryziterrae TaxID=1191699 RepID=UPI0002E63967|nr:molybdopterin converting factor subunit 1 [Calidifontibacillus oryziterrae]
MIDILLFAHLQEAIGDSKINWSELPITVGELKQKLSGKYNVSFQAVMVAVNEEYAEDEMELKAGDTVALIPPVSGG